MKPRLFFVSFADLWGQARLALPGFLTCAARLGSLSVMPMGNRPRLSPPDARPDLLQSLKAALKKPRVRRNGDFDGFAVDEVCSPLRGDRTLQNLDACATTYLKWMRA
jgi:hypothetical protein